MKEKPYTIIGKHSVGSCVLKLIYDHKFVIVKCKSMFTTLKGIENGLNAFIRGGKNNPDGFYFHLFNYVKDNPGHVFTYEILLESDSGYELLKVEHSAIRSNIKNPECLGNLTAAHVAAYNEETQLFGWIRPIDITNFKKWLKKHPNKSFE
jgi:uncharacterized protein YlaN (UPF0358 family)